MKWRKWRVAKGYVSVDSNLAELTSMPTAVFMLQTSLQQARRVGSKQKQQQQQQLVAAEQRKV
jgi:hypothetical protein